MAEANINSSIWNDPIPLEGTAKLPEFPVEVLPEKGYNIVEAVSDTNQVDTGLTASIYLSVLSSCLAKHGVVDLKTHTEPLNIYVCSILPSGERKSSTFSHMMRPITEFQNETGAIIAVDDITPEMLGTLMIFNGERISIMSAEGGIFDIMAGRYGKKASNLDLFLKAHTGDAWSSHRIGRGGERMAAPALTICLTVQPEVIKLVGKNDQLRGRGLLARFLYSNCEPQAGFRQRRRRPVKNNLQAEYEDNINSLITLPFRARNLKLSQQAHGMWDRFYNDVEKELRVGGRLYLFKDWGSKLAGAVARVAGLLHMGEYGDIADALPIEDTTMRGAIEIGSYYMEHAIATFELMGENKDIESAKKILEFINRNDIAKFKGRDVIRHTGLKTMGDVVPGIKVLLERSYIKEIATEYSRSGRPESATYEVNPKLK